VRGPWRTTPAGALVERRWKLVEFFEDARVELYDLDADPGESEDLSSADPERTRAMAERLRAWRERTHAPMPELK